MDGQLFLTWLLIGLAGAYLFWRGRRAWQASKGGCGGGCGCSKSVASKAEPALIAPELLTLRPRPKFNSNLDGPKNENAD
jgi:hypothetical protein